MLDKISTLPLYRPPPLYSLRSVSPFRWHVVVCEKELFVGTDWSLRAPDERLRPRRLGRVEHAEKRQPSRRDAIGSGRRRRDAGRACRPLEAGWAVHCHSSCPSPWATPLRNAHLLWRRRSAARSPPRTTHRAEASSTATAPSLRQAPLQSARAILQSVFAPLQSARGHSPVCFHTSPVCSRPF